MRRGVRWRVSDSPLPPLGLVARGAVAPVLRAWFLGREPQVMARYTGVAWDGGLVVCGADLPWVEGARYVGAAPGTSALWLPTNRLPDVPLALLERALVARWPDASAPIVLLEDVAIPLGSARPLRAASLQEASW